VISALLMVAGTFVATVPWGQHLIALLRGEGIGKQIRADGPQTHEVKRGTPTMGGILIVVPVLLIGGLVAVREVRLWVPIAVTLVFAGLGAVDDVRGLRDEEGVGWLARYKLPWQLALATPAALALYVAGAPQTVKIPVLGASVAIGLYYVPVAALIIAGMANAVNFTDGLDGQAGGTAALAFAAYGLIALSTAVYDVGLALLCAVFVGAILAFLWYNVHPARMFMGDTGALALGAGLAAVALLTEYWLLLLVIGVVFVAELLSVVLQVVYFKLTHGQRIFRMTPLHHHFELEGWPETQITLRFCIAAAVAAMLGVVLAAVR
jgi:phospho-N-acetylmuramoyl-pentapeptide-transferase